jgi:hypothetical protein
MFVPGDEIDIERDQPKSKRNEAGSRSRYRYWAFEASELTLPLLLTCFLSKACPL